MMKQRSEVTGEGQQGRRAAVKPYCIMLEEKMIGQEGIG